MNSGAVKILDRFEHIGVLQEICGQVMGRKWLSTNPDYAYLADAWTAFHFYQDGKETTHAADFPDIRTVRAFFQCPIEQVMFYAVRPGTHIHPHRDMSGNLPFGRLRFHIPIVTNPGAKLIVGGETAQMREGELWALDTSYEHSVENNGQETRVHCVVQVVVNDWVWSLLPKRTMTYYLHVVGFWAYACLVGIKKLFVDPAFILRSLGLRRRAS